MAENMKDCVTLRMADEEQVCIPVSEYTCLVKKAQRLDMLTEEIREKISAGEPDYALIDSELVLLLTDLKSFWRRKAAENKAAEAASNETINETIRQAASALETGEGHE